MLFISAAKSLLCDRSLVTYWLARGWLFAIMSLYGVALVDLGHGMSSTLIIWSASYLAIAIVYIVIDSQAVKRQIKMILCCGYGSVLAGTYLCIIGMNTLAFMAMIILANPIFREVIHCAVIYVRERADWPLGVDVASGLLNEFGKGIGAVFLALLGCLLVLPDTWLFATLSAGVFVIVISLQRSIRNQRRSSKAHIEEHPDIGPVGREYLVISMIHNGLFFGIQAYLSLTLFDLLKSVGFGDNATGMLGGALAVIMLFGLMIFSWLRARAGRSVVAKGNSPLFVLSTAMIAGLYGITFLASINLQPKMIVVLGIALSFIVAFGGFYSIGTLQILDAAYRHKPERFRLAARRRVLHLNAVVSNFSPGVVILLVAWTYLSAPNIQEISKYVFGSMFISEIVLVYAAVKLNQKARGQGGTSSVNEPLEGKALDLDDFNRKQYTALSD